jgi:hypothetical protein
MHFLGGPGEGTIEAARVPYRTAKRGVLQALLILLICLVTLAILAGRYGVDSRDGLDWSPPDRARSRGRL